MHKLYELKDILVKELERYADQPTLNLENLNVIDTLAHSAKNVCKIIESCEEEKRNYDYSGRYMPPMMPNMSYSGRRDSMGRYSRATDGFHMELQEMIDRAPNESVRQKLMSIMNEV